MVRDGQVVETVGWVHALWVSGQEIRNAHSETRLASRSDFEVPPSAGDLSVPLNL